LTLQTTANMYFSSGGNIHFDSESDIHVQAMDGIVMQTIAPQGIHISSSGGDITFEAGYTVMTGHLDVVNEIMATDFSSLSDRRLKKNILPIGSAVALDMVKKMRGVTYEWKNTTKTRRDGRRHVGMIAQEVEAILPQVVAKINGYRTVSYSRITPLLVEAVKAQQEQLSEQGRDVQNVKLEVERARRASCGGLRKVARSLHRRVVALRAEVRAQEADNVALRAEAHAQEAKIAALQAENAALKRANI
jgi:hypothetical protein